MADSRVSRTRGRSHRASRVGSRGQVRVAQGQQQDAQLAAALLHQVHDPGGGAAGDANPDPGTLPGQTAEDRGQEVAGGRVGTGQQELAPRAVGLGAQILEAAQFRKDPGTAGAQLLALGGGLDPAGGAFQQAHAQLGLQGLDLPGDGGLGAE